MAEARYEPEVIARIQAPYEAKPYHEYRKLFINEALVREGRRYLRAHRRAFDRAQRRYQVEAPVVAAILGVETHYGRHQGRFRVLDALYTLAVGYPPRSAFFTSELGAFLQLAFQERIDPKKVLGSYAGAFGITQFIPSSYQAYAVDADGDGARDVWRSHADAIASVANYFRAHGWRMHRPIVEWLGAREDLADLDDPTLQRFVPLAEIKPRLGRLRGPWRRDDLVSVIRLPTEAGPRYALVHKNLYVITRWNRSVNYAMVVAELAGRLGCRACWRAR